MIAGYDPMPRWPLPLGYAPEHEAEDATLVATVTMPAVTYGVRWQVSWDDGETWQDCQAKDP